MEISKSLNVIFEMLVDRKIIEQDYHNKYKGLLENIDTSENKKTFVVDITPKIKVIYMLLKVRSDTITSMVAIKEPLDLMIIVTLHPLTDNNIKAIESTISTLCNVYEVFEIKELQFNITKHSLQPKFNIITDQEDIKKIAEKYGLVTANNSLKLNMLPYILKTDPIARYYGMKPGNILEVTRISPTSGIYVSYRLCV